MNKKTKFFKMVDTDIMNTDYYCCEKSTPLPTAEEIVSRFKMNPDCKRFSIVEITKEEFLQGINNILNDIVDKSADMWEWSPNNEKNLHLWRFWESEL